MPASAPVWNVHATRQLMDVVRRDLRQPAVAPTGVVAVIGRPAVRGRIQQRRRIESLRGWRGAQRQDQRTARDRQRDQRETKHRASKIHRGHRLLERLEIREHVVHVVVGVLPELRDVRIERVIDGDGHLTRRPRAVVAGRIGNRNGELVAIGNLAADRLARRQLDGGDRGGGATPPRPRPPGYSIRWNSCSPCRRPARPARSPVANDTWRSRRPR